jgi:hypothetical protein
MLYTTQSDPETVCAMLAAVRCMARLSGDLEISLRIALSGEKCERCRRVCEMFVEPAGVCTICWSILILNTAVQQLKESFEGPNPHHNSGP